ncbi:MAG: tripartite tricarboxylate transporter substrate-binding protein [Pollutimonas bauzanensis]|uniref:Tripartite-type tricarboxylate transporter, receptor component TctC n=1 Tax=Pollutimonas bauzanensis TaxID=658167 RepID=A0A1M5ZTA2_9BURK|nr:tripartite tricarboxylate transporter substrate-binding protein [Pollutimonas bauzanensis]SHI27153.1 Tripartite-type tricarboxylate transporter, receptor component TctC [Pollutimonas bauzanensis]
MKHLIHKIAPAMSALMLAAAAQAATHIPSQITIIVPFGAGASNDSIARVIAPELAQRLKTNVIVENKAGAAGAIGSAYVAKSASDGATLLLSSSTFVTSAATQPNIPYDALRSFAPVAMIGQGPLVIAVSGDGKYKSLDDVLGAARQNPGKLNYGSSGIGSLAHLATTLMNNAAGVDITHVPYKGAAGAAGDLAGGRIDLMLANYSSLASLLEAGKVRLVATTAPGKNAAFPDLPPASAAIPGYDVDIWVGVFAPAGTPADLIEAYNRAFNEINRSKRLGELLALDGTEPTSMSSKAFAQRVASDLERWKAIAARHNITAN